MDSLHKEGMFPRHQTVWWFKRHWNQYGSVEPLQSSGQPTKPTDEVIEVINIAMQEDDETTTRELHVWLQQLNAYTPNVTSNYPERLEIAWVDFLRIQLLWTFMCSEQRVAIAVGWKNLHDGFEDVVHVDRWNHCSTGDPLLFLLL